MSTQNRNKEPSRLLSKAIFRHNYTKHLPIELVLSLATTTKMPSTATKLEKDTDYFLCYRRRKGNLADPQNADFYYYQVKITCLKFFGDSAKDDDQHFFVVEVPEDANDEFAQYTNFTIPTYGIAWYLYIGNNKETAAELDPNN
jgi:hypothetical protein